VSKPTFALLIAASALLASSGAHADMFRCVDGAGRSLYTDRPCPGGSRAEEVITAAKVCGSADCLERRERKREEAQQERARVEREQMEALRAEQERRLRAEAEAQWLEAALRARQVAAAPVQPAIEPDYLVYVSGLLCTGPRCFPRPDKPHHRDSTRRSHEKGK
jgi:hypothetical protein